jgi:cytidine deaminase
MQNKDNKSQTFSTSCISTTKEQVMLEKTNIRGFIMYEKLKILIKKAKTPLTDRKVACILVSSKNEIYGGYNLEESRILHAEEMALNQAIKKSENFKIKEIHLMARGIAQNVKRAIPCENCSNILTPYCKEDSKIIFYLFNNPNKRYELKFKDILESYRSFDDILLLEDKLSFDEYFANYLTPIDRKILKEFMDGIKTKCSELYVTGSASKRGGPKQLLAKEITGVSYWDIDLIAIFPEINKDQINKIVREVILNSLRQAGFDVKKLLEKEVPSYILEESPNNKDSENFIFRKIYWSKDIPLKIMSSEYKKDILIPSMIDLSVGKNLKETITKRYLDKNWLVKIVDNTKL